MSAIECLEREKHVVANVEVIRANNGAARAPHETCLRRASDPLIGSEAPSFVS